MESLTKIIRAHRFVGKYGWQTAAGWFVPPIVVPALLIFLAVIRATYLALQ
jgi:hypothetical protein